METNNHITKIKLYLILGIVLEIPSALYSFNEMLKLKKSLYWNLGCSFIFMCFYLLYYSLKEYKRSRNSRLDKQYLLIFIMIFLLNTLNIYTIIDNIFTSDFEGGDKDYILIFLMIFSISQTILTTIDFFFSFIKFIISKIKNFMINQRIILFFSNNSDNNANSSLINQVENNIIIEGNEIEEILKYKISNREIIELRKEDEECTICLEFVMINSESNFAIKTICEHFFHYFCLKSLILNTDKCPNCRGELNL